MSMEKLLDCSGPIDKNAARVIRKARPEDVWIPKANAFDHIRHSENVLQTKPIPLASIQMAEIIGERRDRFTVIGYAADQNKNKPAKWVVRCDCGNYEHRSRILRWLFTEAPDMCVECRLREYLTKGYSLPREPAIRRLVEAV
jgi:hypothetical protein